jgi:hypothetical protein
VISLDESRRCRGKALVALMALVLVASGILCSSAAALPFSFSTGSPDGSMAMASRPGGPVEVEAGDDFVLSEQTVLNNATFTGLLPTSTPPSAIEQVRVMASRPFPADSDVTRTSGAPTFSTPEVPTRVNSPADVPFAQAESADGSLSFTASVFGPFTALNSVAKEGIHPKPSQTTGGNGPVSGEEVTIDTTFSPPLRLAAGHYFFEPQVAVSAGEFFWLSAPGATFPSGSTDFQAWIRNSGLAPDWLRVGGDIVGGGQKFNASFSLAGTTCQTLFVSPTSIPTATAGSPYSVTFSASGGASPYSFGETGALPKGVSLTSDGKLSGSPAQAGSFPITITATDASGCQGTVGVTLTVRAASSPGGPSGPGKGGPSNTTASGPPNTKISSLTVSSKKRKAKARFKAIGSATGFQCALMRGHRKPKFKKCRSPKTYKHLGAGRYTFEVRALGPPGMDPTPAKRKFRIRPA